MGDRNVAGVELDTRLPEVAAPVRASGEDEWHAGVAWLGLVAVALTVGTVLVARWRGPGLDAAPLDGRWDWRPGLRLVPAVGLGAAVVLWAPGLARTVRWRPLVGLAAGATVVWSVALAAADGWARVSGPLTTRHEYLRGVAHVDDPWEFLRTYTDRLADYPVHLKGHPPGLTLVLWGLERLGLGGAGWASALVIAGAGLATASVLVALRDVAGESAARRAAPFVAIGPPALWYATSGDALYAGVIALGCALLIVGRRPATFVVGGVVLGLALHLTYGAVPLLVIPLAVAWWRRDRRPVVGLAVGVLAVTVAFSLAGFWWLDGLSATRHWYRVGISRHRPDIVFTPFINPGALALMTGPAAAVGLWLLWQRWHRDRLPSSATPGLLAGAALVAVVAADLSGMSKGEVERIWLPFAPWLLTATAVIPAVRAKGWLGAQVGLALVLQAAVRSPW